MGRGDGAEGGPGLAFLAVPNTPQVEWPSIFSAGPLWACLSPWPPSFSFLWKRPVQKEGHTKATPSPFLGILESGLQYCCWEEVRNYDSISFFLFLF